MRVSSHGKGNLLCSRNRGLIQAAAHNAYEVYVGEADRVNTCFTINVTIGAFGLTV